MRLLQSTFLHLVILDRLLVLTLHLFKLILQSQKLRVIVSISRDLVEILSLMLNA
jgi:hypothetical protein